VSDEPRVLIIPGLNGHAGMLMKAAPALFPGMRAVAFDHRFDLIEDGVEGMAARAIAAMREEGGDEPFFVCGESFGGTVALTIARQAPELVRGLMLFSTFGFYPRVASSGGKAGLWVLGAVGDRFVDKWFRVGRPFSIPGQLGFRFPREVAEDFLGRPAAHLPAYREKCALSVEFDALPWLPEIDCPALVLIGSWDPVVPTSCGRQLAQLLPRAELRQLPGGHLVHLVRAHEVGAVVADWAAGHSNTAAD
jgi:aminoacrylate hydrolase